MVTILFELAASLVGALVGALRRAFRRPPTDLVLRRRILGHFAAAGSRPSPDDVEASPADFARLAERHALVLDSAGRIVIANPFSGVETDFEVQSEGSTWFANCAWDGLGILAALGRDGRLRTSCSDCDERLTVEVAGGRVRADDAVAHFLLPAARWYDDLAYT